MFFQRPSAHEYNKAMPRALAILLMSIFGLGLIAPLLSAGSGASLPLCCREKGKHHCAMKMAQSLQNRAHSTVSNIGEKCPYFPKTWTIAANSQTFLPRGRQLFFGDVLSHPAVQAQTEARYRISFSRSRQKRGPPSFLFS